MDILLLLLLLQIKHWYSDFKVQTYQQTVKKGIYADPVGISHSLDHIYTSMIVLLVFCFYKVLPAGDIVVVSILEGIIHYHIDWVKVRFGCKDHTQPLFWNQFGLDQLAHQVTYLAMAAYFLL
jgi:hypothetical protein